MSHETLICPRCKRELHAWPLHRADVCSPKAWAYCIRQERDVRAQIAATAAKEAQRVHERP